MARAKPKRRTAAKSRPKTKAKPTAKPKTAARSKTGQVRGTVDPKARALLDAVLADPTDIQARLVYADFLVERGDPRGEFIHVQCALGRAVVDASGRSWGKPTFDGDPAELEKRERKLLSLHQKAWLAPVRETIRTWNWSRGFISKVVADCGNYLKGSARLFAEMPVIGVQLTALKPPMLHTLASQPTSAKLRELDVNFQKLDAAALEAFRSDTWRDLRDLNLAGNRFGVAGARTLLTCTLPGLRTLEITDGYLTDDAVAELAQAPFFARLEHLDLSYNHGITSMAPLVGARSLVSLRLRSTEIASADLEQLITALPALTEFEGNLYDRERVDAILAARKLTAA